MLENGTIAHVYDRFIIDTLPIYYIIPYPFFHTKWMQTNLASVFAGLGVSVSSVILDVIYSLLDSSLNDYSPTLNLSLPEII